MSRTQTQLYFNYFLLKVSLFLTMIGVMSSFLCFPITFYLLTAEIETVPSSWNGWLLVLLSSLFGLCFNWLVNYGVSVTFPLFIAVGYTLHVPANAIVDRIARQVNYLFITLLAVLGIETERNKVVKSDLNRRNWRLYVRTIYKCL